MRIGGPAVFLPMRTISRDSRKIAAITGSAGGMKPGHMIIGSINVPDFREIRADKTGFGTDQARLSPDLRILKSVVGKTRLPLFRLI